MPKAEVRVTYRGRQAAVQLSDDIPTLQQLSEAIDMEFHVLPAEQKLLVGGKVLWPAQAPGLAVSDAGIINSVMPAPPHFQRRVLFQQRSSCIEQLLQELRLFTRDKI